MFELFSAMVKEEWRVHTTLFGTAGFILFPLLLLFLAFCGALLWPLFTDVMSPHMLVVLTHYCFVIAGMSVGAFGLFGREVMNRRFGQASLLAYSSRSLPVSEQTILLNFLIKDTVYYFFFWVLPFVAGVAFAAPWIGVPSTYIPLILLTLTLSFLIGLSGVFLLSTIYVNSSRLLLLVLLAGLIWAGFLARKADTGLSDLLPPLGYFYHPSAASLLLSLLLIIITCAISIRFVKVGFREETRRFANALDRFSERFSWSRYAHFIAKDVLDLTRSEGGAEKIVFSFLFPVMFIWIALFVLMRFIPAINILIVFAILMGVISSTIYNWVTEFDIFTSYAFLPVEVPAVIRAKLQSYGLLNLVSVGIIIAAALGTGEIMLLLPALVTFVSVSFYAVAVTIYLAGLYPTVMLYNAKVYVPYLALISPVLLILIFISIPNPWFALISVLAIPAAAGFLNKGYARWSIWDHPDY
jgi:hypothetical protein